MALLLRLQHPMFPVKRREACRRCCSMRGGPPQEVHRPATPSQGPALASRPSGGLKTARSACAVHCRDASPRGRYRRSSGAADSVLPHIILARDALSTLSCTSVDNSS